MNRPVLVLGGGLTGLQAAAEIVDAGAQALLLEQGPILGGKRAAWLAGAGDGVDARLAVLADNPAVECLTLAELGALEGEAGAFTARVVQQPRFVTADCTSNVTVSYAFQIHIFRQSAVHTV